MRTSRLRLALAVSLGWVGISAGAAPATAPSSGLADALLAKTADSRLARQLELFGRFVGDWEVAVTNHLPDGTRQTLNGEWHFGWILGGAAIQDVWMVPARAERASGKPLVAYGTTLRFYDAKLDAWHGVWASASYRNFILFTARGGSGEITMEAENAQPPIRWVFSDVTAQSFRWRAMESKDGWKTADVQQEMTATRVSDRGGLAAALLASGPAPGFEAENRLFGQFAGDWTIRYEGFPRDGSIVETTGALNVGWILDGRAVQDVWRFDNPKTGEGSAGTTLRVYDPRLDAWHSIWFYPAGNVIETFVARQKSDEIVLDGASPTGLPQQWIFSKITPGSFDWREVVSTDNRATWYVTEHMWIARRAATSSPSSR